MYDVRYIRTCTSVSSERTGNGFPFFARRLSTEFTRHTPNMKCSHNTDGDGGCHAQCQRMHGEEHVPHEWVIVCMCVCLSELKMKFSSTHSCPYAMEFFSFSRRHNSGWRIVKMKMEIEATI